MRPILLIVAAVSVVVAASTPAASAPPIVRHCGNYGFPKGHHGDEPIFTNRPIVGAGVEDIRVRVIGCRKGRRMVKVVLERRLQLQRRRHALHVWVVQVPQPPAR